MEVRYAPVSANVCGINTFQRTVSPFCCSWVLSVTLPNTCGARSLFRIQKTPARRVADDKTLDPEQKKKGNVPVLVSNSDTDPTTKVAQEKSLGFSFHKTPRKSPYR
jgi:hypothetical protein